MSDTRSGSLRPDLDYVDEDGNSWDDEGNVTRKGAAFGRQYGGQTYTGTRAPWQYRTSSGRKTTYVGADTNAEQIAAVEDALASKPNNFLQSVLGQLQQGRGLSSKQKAVVRKILAKIDPDSASLFESKKVRITVNQLREIIRESKDRAGRVGGGQGWKDDEEDLDESDRYDDPGSRPSWEDDASHPDSPDYDDDADDFYEWRHQEDQNDMEYYIAVSLEQAARDNPGVDGKSLLRIARQDPEYAPLLQGVTDTRMFEVADSMIDEETLFFDVEEDAWYYAPEMR